jgi:single-strand DNA-binding protein
MNFIHIAGHLGADPEVRFTSSNKKVTSLRVAVRSRRGKNPTDNTIWFRVTLWGEQWDKMVSYLKKGSPVMAFGELHKPEIFNDREGKPTIAMEITATHLEFSPFGKPGSSEEGSSSHQQSHQPAGFAAAQAPQAAPNPYMSAKPEGQTFDDEVPF